MDLIFHPEAIKNFNERANELLLKLLPQAPTIEKKQSFESGIIANKLEEKDILSIGPVREVDYTGRTISMFFNYKNQNIGLFEENFTLLIKLSEDIQKSGKLDDKVNIKFICKTIFDWMKEKYCGKPQDDMMDFLMGRCKEEIKIYEIWIPIAYTLIEEEFEIGSVKFKNLSKGIFDNWENELLKKAKDDNHKQNIIKSIEKERKEKQGRLIAILKLESEKSRGEDLAFERIDEALGILRLFSPATFYIDINSLTTIKGFENLETRECYIVENNLIKTHSKSLLTGRQINWIIGKELLEHIKKDGLNILSELLLKVDRNNFEEKVLNSLLLFSRGTLMKSIPDRLVYIFAALESILIKNDTESIQQNLADRIAFAISRDGRKRMQIVKCVKDSYTYRSKFVHHGLKTDDIDLLNEFIRISSTFLFSLLSNINNFKTKEDLINAIEKSKYGV